MKFKAGDVVTRINRFNNYLDRGHTATVNSPAYKGVYLQVIWHHLPRAHRSNGSFYDRDFVLASEYRDPEIVEDTRSYLEAVTGGGDE